MTELEEWVDGNQWSNRELIFPVYGSQMLPLNQIVCKDDVLSIVKELSKVTNWKYTFHNEGMPRLTICGEQIKEWA